MVVSIIVMLKSVWKGCDMVEFYTLLVRLLWCLIVLSIICVGNCCLVLMMVSLWILIRFLSCGRSWCILMIVMLCSRCFVTILSRVGCL